MIITLSTVHMENGMEYQYAICFLKCLTVADLRSICNDFHPTYKEIVYSVTLYSCFLGKELPSTLFCLICQCNHLVLVNAPEASIIVFSPGRDGVRSVA